MAKSLRSKRKKRLRTLRREIAEPFYDKKESAKLQAQEAALNAPKLPVRMPRNNDSNAAMAIEQGEPSPPAALMDVEMADAGKSKSLLKPVGGVGKKQLKKKIKMKKDKRKSRGKGKIRRSNI